MKTVVMIDGEHYLPVRITAGNTGRNRFENVMLEQVVADEPPFMKGKIF